MKPAKPRNVNSGGTHQKSLRAVWPNFPRCKGTSKEDMTGIFTLANCERCRQARTMKNAHAEALADLISLDFYNRREGCQGECCSGWFWRLQVYSGRSGSSDCRW